MLPQPNPRDRTPALPPPPIHPDNLPPIRERLLIPAATLTMPHAFDRMPGEGAPSPAMIAAQEPDPLPPYPRATRYEFMQECFRVNRAPPGATLITENVFHVLSPHLHRVRAGVLNLYVPSECVSVVLTASDFSVTFPLFNTHSTCSPAVAAAALGRSVDVPVAAGRLLLGSGLELYLVNCHPTQPLRRVHVILTLKSCSEAIVRCFFDTVRSGATLREEFLTSTFSRDLDYAKEGIVMVFSQELDTVWTANENWDSTVQEDMEKFVNDTTRGYLPLMSSLFGHSVSLAHENGALELGVWQGVWCLKLTPLSRPRSRMIAAIFPKRDRRDHTYYQKRVVKVGTLGSRFTHLRETVGDRKWDGWFEKVEFGFAHFYLRHTTATIMISNSNLVEEWMEDIKKLVPEDLPYVRHIYQGSDDMPSHIKVSMFGPTLTVPIRRGTLALEEWQQVSIAEFRTRHGGRTRDLTIIVEGTYTEFQEEHESDLDGDEQMWGLNWDKSYHHHQPFEDTF